MGLFGGWFGGGGPRVVPDGGCAVLGTDAFFPVALDDVVASPRGRGHQTPLIPSAISAFRPGDYPFQAETGAMYAKAGVAAYVFRGDNRTPEELRQAGGFWSNRTRQDVWSPDPLDPSGHVLNPNGSSFVAFSRSPFVALGFALKGGGTEGYVYAVLVEGGLELQRLGMGFGAEEEVIAVGGVGWENVVAYRNVWRPPTPHLFVRQGFGLADPSGERRVRAAMAFRI